jgi:DNA-binding NtrC family response regulator
VTGQEALEKFRASPAPVVVLDLMLPGGMDGQEVLRQVKALKPETAVILITGFGSIKSAVQAIRRGAEDYLTKPFEPSEIVLVIEKALEARKLREENRELRARLDQRDSYGGLVLGRSPAMRKLYATMDAAAASDATVLLMGESGTGKEIVARAIHAGGRRATAPILPVSCAALPGPLFESAVFGHVKGAFTGAAQARRGLVERAEGGTLFLDEIAELPLALQPKLLRFLERKEYAPVGAEEARRADVRVMASTHRELEAEVAAGRFRSDLFFRLNVLALRVPALRERGEDVLLLARHFLALYAERYGKPVVDFNPPAAASMSAHPWPGNVRELMNVVERAVALGEGESVEAVPFDAPAAGGPALREGPLREASRDFERRFLEELLRAEEGNVSAAARRAGVSRPNLYRKLKELGLDPGRFKSS